MYNRDLELMPPNPPNPTIINEAAVPTANNKENSTKNRDVLAPGDEDLLDRDDGIWYYKGCYAWTVDDFSDA